MFRFPEIEVTPQLEVELLRSELQCLKDRLASHQEFAAAVVAGNMTYGQVRSWAAVLVKTSGPNPGQTSPVVNTRGLVVEESEGDTDGSSADVPILPDLSPSPPLPPQQPRGYKPTFLRPATGRSPGQPSYMREDSYYYPTMNPQVRIPHGKWHVRPRYDILRDMARSVWECSGKPPDGMRLMLWWLRDMFHEGCSTATLGQIIRDSKSTDELFHDERGHYLYLPPKN